MEKRIRKIKKAFTAFVIFCSLSLTLSSQSVTQKNKIRFVLWSNVDSYPGVLTEESSDGNTSASSENGIYDYAIKSLKKVGPYLINGMVYGWSFSYTPYDKTRGVKEYLEIEPIVPEEIVRKNITYSAPWIENNLFNCWCEYIRSPYEIQEYERWETVKNPVIRGIGYGSLEHGFQGIKEGTEDALKNAVRSYYRNIIKNKPKEITGKVLVKSNPLIGVDAGRYVVNLDFFLECDKIIEYKVF